MIPDKIYIHKKDNPIEITWSEIEEKDCQNVEYIRKDALLEWIQTELKLCESAVAMTRAYHKLIDKLNSL